MKKMLEHIYCPKWQCEEGCCNGINKIILAIGEKSRLIYVAVMLSWLGLTFQYRFTVREGRNGK